MIDDFFFMSTDESTCTQHLNSFIDLCHDIGIPLAPDKTTNPSHNTIFLGIELDTVKQSAILPSDKLEEYRADIQLALQHRKIRRKAMESLIGKLSFAASVVPARAFLRRLINTIYTVQKPYHYIQITKGMRQDLITWVQFLNNYNGITYFRALNVADSQVINMSSDASKLGFGACYGSQWIQSKYPTSWQSYHITVLEFYPIYVLIAIFGPLLRNSSILFKCENSAVVEIINKQTSKNPTVMMILRPLILLLVEYNVHLRASHIPGLTNILPDKISRFQITTQLLQDYKMNPQPTPIPTHLQPDYFKLS